jgi:hypothetical protein
MPFRPPKSDIKMLSEHPKPKKHGPFIRFAMGFIFCGSIMFAGALLYSSAPIFGWSLRHACTAAIIAGLVGGFAAVRGGRLAEFVGAFFSRGP